MINNDRLNALYLIYQGYKINRIDFNAWYDFWNECQSAVLDGNADELDVALKKRLIELNKKAAN